MSPHAADRFTGHMPEGDPRSPLFGSAGCTWPTVPGYNLFMGSDNATGALVWLNTIGIQLKIGAPPHDPRNMQWVQNGGLSPILDVFVLKNELLNPYGYQFSFVITTIVGFVEGAVTFPEQTCNRTHILGDWGYDPNPPVGRTGSTFRLLQVEWDEERPPGGFP